MKIVSNSSRLQLVVSYKLFYKLVIYMIYKYIFSPVVGPTVPSKNSDEDSYYEQSTSKNSSYDNLDI